MPTELGGLLEEMTNSQIYHSNIGGHGDWNDLKHAQVRRGLIFMVCEVTPRPETKGTPGFEPGTC